MFPGRAWTHEEGVESSHKLFRLNLRNISLLWWTKTWTRHSSIVGAGDVGLEDRSGT